MDYPVTTERIRGNINPTDMAGPPGEHRSLHEKYLLKPGCVHTS